MTLPRPRNRGLFLLLLGVVVITAVSAAVVRLPGVPYNVRELFWGNSLKYLVWFALAVLWMGWGSAWLANRISRRRFPIGALPGWFLACGALSYLLLYFAVTPESLSDILGAPVLQRWGIEKRQWGADTAALLTSLGRWLDLGFWERMVRYIALTGPLLLGLALFQAGGLQSRDRGWRHGLAYFTIYLVLALPWLLLCEWIAFDLAVTDNLSELIAPPAWLGLGGGFWLYLLVLLLAANVALLAVPEFAGLTGLRLGAARIFVTLAAVPLGWWLLNLGLAGPMDKFGSQYSAVDFLLGPDRRQRLGPVALYLRWMLLQWGIVCVLVYGARVFHAMFPAAPGAESVRGVAAGLDWRRPPAA